MASVCSNDAAMGNFPDEIQLINDLRGGDVQAFDALYYRYFQPIKQNIFKLVKDPDAVDDLIQDVFITLWEKKDGLSPEKGVAAWLYVVSFNKSLKFLQKSLKENNEKLMFLEVTHHGEGEKDEHEFELSLSLIENAIAQLSERRRIAFCKCRLQGCSLDEVATAMGIGKETVKGYLKEARLSIRSYLQEHHPGGLSLGCFLFLYCYLL